MSIPQENIHVPKSQDVTDFLEKQAHLYDQVGMPPDVLAGAENCKKQKKNQEQIKKIDQDEETPWYTKFFGTIQFFFYYVGITLCIFGVLLAITNYQAYATLIYSYFHKEDSQKKEQKIENTIKQTQIIQEEQNIESIDTQIDQERHALIHNIQENIAQKEARREKIEELKKLKHELEIQEKTQQEQQKVLEEYVERKALIHSQEFELESLIQTQAKQVPIDVTITPYDNRIIIPKIGKNIPIINVDHKMNVSVDDLHEVFMTELERGVIRYPGTANPGENGNSFIFGHSSNFWWAQGAYNEVFARLNELVDGDEIIVYFKQKKYIYVVKEKTVVNPGDINVLNRDDTKTELSLMTCWPIGTVLQRLIVFSELKEISDSY